MASPWQRIVPRSTPVQRQVRLGSPIGDNQSVLSGLRLGEAVVTAGSFFLRAEVLPNPAREARQTEVCAWLAAVLLTGLGLDAWLGWWWADPIATLGMTALIAWEGWQAVRGRTCCAD